MSRSTMLNIDLQNLNQDLKYAVEVNNTILSNALPELADYVLNHTKDYDNHYKLTGAIDNHDEKDG